MSLATDGFAVLHTSPVLLKVALEGLRSVLTTGPCTHLEDLGVRCNVFPRNQVFTDARFVIQSAS